MNKKTYEISNKYYQNVLKRSMMCGTANFQGFTSENCAIALAIRDLFPDANVGLDCISFRLGIFIDLPIEAIAFIQRFDGLYNSPYKRLDLPEFSFEIDVPEECLPTVDISEIQEILKNSTSLQVMI